MAGLDEISTEIGMLKASVSSIQRNQDEAHRIMFDKLDAITKTVTIGSVQIPEMARKIEVHDQKVAELEKEKHERKGAIWGVGLVASAIGSAAGIAAEFLGKHQ